MKPDQQEKIILEDFYLPSDNHLETIGDMYRDFYLFRNNREQEYRQIQFLQLEDFWKQSRELFWNSFSTPSDDLEALGLDFSLPFVRKEVMDFTGRVVSLNLNLMLSGDNIDGFSVKVLQAMYKKWRLKSKDRVEKFWQMLYSTMNGTVCGYVGYDMDERQLNYLTQLDKTTGDFNIENKTKRMWNDAFTEIVPLEEMYLQKIWERNIQKQDKTIRLKEVSVDKFKSMYPEDKYPDVKFVHPGSYISDDSLFYQLLGGSQILDTNKIQILDRFDTQKDERVIVANGIWINALKGGKARPNPFAHKSQPYTWSVHEPIDEKFAYGMSMPFNLKDTTKILNTSFTMFVERELRAIDPPIITSDFEAPDIIFGQQRVVPVNDVDAYKEFRIEEASGAYMTMMNSFQGLMTSFAQGGSAQVAPSKQPKAAREIIAIEKMKQQALGNTLVLYYDLLHQEVMLLLKTMLQFYHSGKYSNQRENLVRSFSVPNFPLTQGGVGELEVRFVKEPNKGLALYFEAVEKSIANGKTTEIIEIPVDIIKNLEFFIDDIKLEPEKDDELERAMFVENVLGPLLNVFIPAGVADINKTYLRFLEKMGEHPQSYTSEQNLPQIMAAWGGAPMQGNPQMNQQQMQQIMQAQAAGAQPQGGGMPVGAGAQTGNLNQSTRGTRFGSKSNGGLPDSI